MRAGRAVTAALLHMALTLTLAWAPWPPAHAEGRVTGSTAAAGPTLGSEPGGASRSGSESSAGLIDFSPAELARITRHGPWPPAPARDAGNRFAGRPDAIALGRRLFFDVRLSANHAVACASCHQPGLAFADGLTRSVGLATVDRNAPSLWNAVHERWYGWDGAADSLWSQSIRPLLDPREMGGSAARLRQVMTTDVELACRYRAVVGRPLAPMPTPPPKPTSALTPTDTDTATPARAPTPPDRPLSTASAMTTAGPPSPSDDEAVLVDAAKFIGAYVGSLVSGRTAFDEFRDALLRGDRVAAAAYSMAAQRGLQLFVGRAGCGTCHVGPMFSNGEFADIGRPFFVRPGVVDPGRQGGIVALRASRYHLLSDWADAGNVASGAASPGAAGRSATDEAALKTRHLAPQHRNFGEFKVPSLRNVALTAPYMHDGSLGTLDEVLTHYSELDLERLHADGEQILKPLHLSPPERADLLAFLHTLSDARATVEPVPDDPACVPAPTVLTPPMAR